MVAQDINLIFVIFDKVLLSFAFLIIARTILRCRQNYDINYLLSI